MVKDTIIEEKNCFSDDSIRRFMQIIQQTTFYQALPIYLFTHSSPLFTHIGFNWFSCYTRNYMPEP